MALCCGRCDPWRLSTLSFFISLIPTPRSGRSHCRRSTRTALLLLFLLTALFALALYALALGASRSVCVSLLADRSACSRSVCSRSVCVSLLLPALAASRSGCVSLWVRLALPAPTLYALALTDRYGCSRSCCPLWVRLALCSRSVCMLSLCMRLALAARSGRVSLCLRSLLNVL